MKLQVISDAMMLKWQHCNACLYLQTLMSAPASHVSTMALVKTASMVSCVIAHQITKEPSVTKVTMQNAVSLLNLLRPRQNRRRFADVFQCNFLNENVWIPIKISLKFVPKCPINTISVLVQIMAWRLLGAKPLSEPMMTRFNNVCMRHSASI